MIVAECRDSIGNRAEIVDDSEPINAEPFLDQRGRMTHGLLVSLSTSPLTGPAKPMASSSGKSTRAAPEFLPADLEARMFGGPQRHRLAQRGDRPSSISASAKRAWVPPTSATQSAHACSASIAASIADAPCSA